MTATQTASRASASGESEILSESDDGAAHGAEDGEYSADDDDQDDADDPLDDDDDEDGTFGQKAKKKAKPRISLSNGDRASNGSAPKKPKKRASFAPPDSNGLTPASGGSLPFCPATVCFFGRRLRCQVAQEEEVRQVDQTLVAHVPHWDGRCG